MFETKQLYIFFLFIYMICLPLGAMNIGSIGSLLKIVSIFPITIALLDVIYIKSNPMLKYYFLFSLLSLFSVIWSIYEKNTLSRAFSLFQLTILLMSTCVFCFTDKDISLIKQSLVWSSRITLLLVVVTSGLYEGRLILTGRIKEDPNYLCMYFVFGVVACVEKLYQVRFKNIFFIILEIILYFYAILLTGSRGGLLAVLVAAVLMIILSGYKKHEEKGKKIRKLILILIGTIGFYLLMGYLSEDLLNRYTIDAVLENGGTGRIEIWTSGIDLFLNRSNVLRKIFGYGSATVAHAFEAFSYRRVSLMHNIFLENLIELGIIGFCLYFIMIKSFIVHSFRLKNKYSFCVLIGFIVMSFTTSLYTFKPYINAMLFILLQQNACYTKQELDS